MCGRYSLTNPAGIPDRFRLPGLSQVGIEPRFNVAPTQTLPVMVGASDGPALYLMRWGFEPFWLRRGSRRRPQINAKAETLLESPMFRDSVAGHRCVIPADGFYEWQAAPDRKKPQPLHIRLKGGELFAFAGIFTGRPERPDDASYAIITTSPNELVAQVHDRMPVILDPGDEGVWLDPDLADPVAVLGCLRPYPSEHTEAYRVSPLVGAAWNEGPELIEPLGISQRRLWSL